MIESSYLCISHPRLNPDTAVGWGVSGLEGTVQPAATEQMAYMLPNTALMYHQGGRGRDVSVYPVTIMLRSKLAGNASERSFDAVPCFLSLILLYLATIMTS